MPVARGRAASSTGHPAAVWVCMCMHACVGSESFTAITVPGSQRANLSISVTFMMMCWSLPGFASMWAPCPLSGQATCSPLVPPASPVIPPAAPACSLPYPLSHRHTHHTPISSWHRLIPCPPWGLYCCCTERLFFADRPPPCLMLLPAAPRY